MYLFYNPTPRNGCFSGIFTILLTQHPAMLRKTVGEKGYVRYKPADEMSFSTPPSLCATSPIFCDAKHPVRLRDTAGEECEIFQRFCFTGVLSSPMLRLLLLSVADEMRKGRSRCLTLFLLLSVFFDISIELAPPLFRATFPICLCHRGGTKRLFSLISY